MTGKERLKASLDFTEPDRIPFDLGGTTVSTISKTAFLRAAAFRGLSADGILNTDIDPIQQIVFPDDETIAALRIDTRRLGLPRLFGEYTPPAEQDGGLSLTDQFGCTWFFNPKSDFYYNMKSVPLHGFETIEEGLEGFRFPTLLGKRDDVFRAFDEQAPRPDSGCGLVLDRNCAGLTEVAFRIRGYEQFFIDMALAQSGSERLLDRILAYKLEYWDLVGAYLRERGSSGSALVAVECDDMGTQSSLLFSPEMLKSIVMPRQKTLVSHIKKQLPDIKVLFHSDGAVFDIIPELIDIGVDILNPVQWTASGMDLVTLKKEFGKDIVFWGAGIDTQETLPHGTPEAVREEVKRNIDILAPGGGFVFAAIHNIQADVPPENFWAMWDTFMEHSAY
jgi:uroporphyrinogen decarboxylase